MEERDLRVGHPRPILAAGAIVLFMIAGAASGDVVYSSGFEGPDATLGMYWSHTQQGTTPGERGFLGEFNNDRVNLSVHHLPDHDSVTISFDLYLMRSWDGNQVMVGPDVFTAGVEEGPMFVHATFAAQPASHTRPQSYPNSYGEGLVPEGTGAFERNTLGYMWAGETTDAVYRMSFTFPHQASDISFYFMATGLQSIDDESWGLDNVRVEITPVPAPAALGLLGLGVMLIGRRRR